MKHLVCGSCGSGEFVRDENGQMRCEYCGTPLEELGQAPKINRTNLKIIIPSVAVFVCVAAVVLFSRIGGPSSDAEDTAGFSYYGEIVEAAMESQIRSQDSEAFGRDNIEIVEPWTLEIFDGIETAVAMTTEDGYDVIGDGDNYYELVKTVGEPTSETRMERGDDVSIAAQWQAVRFDTQVNIMIQYAEDTGVITYKWLYASTSDALGIPRVSGNDDGKEKSISERRNEFETRYAVTPEQERWLAFSPFVPVLNYQSARTLALTSSKADAKLLLRSSWSVTDHESAIRQLERLSSATGQSPRGNDLWKLIRVDNGIDYGALAMEFRVLADRAENGEDVSLSDGEIAAKLGAPVSELQSLYQYCAGRLSPKAPGFSVMADMAELAAGRKEVFERAKHSMVTTHDYTEEEIMGIETLAAWDYGRTSIIARYGFAAGYISEEEAWRYLKLSAENARPLYNGWREYTAAYLVGRAVAYGNDSYDMTEAVDFLLTADRSPFKTIEY